MGAIRGAGKDDEFKQLFVSRDVSGFSLRSRGGGEEGIFDSVEGAEESGGGIVSSPRQQHSAEFSASEKIL